MKLLNWVNGYKVYIVGSFSILWAGFGWWKGFIPADVAQQTRVGVIEHHG